MTLQTVVGFRLYNDLTLTTDIIKSHSMDQNDGPFYNLSLAFK